MAGLSSKRLIELKQQQDLAIKNNNNDLAYKLELVMKMVNEWLNQEPKNIKK